MDLLSDSTVQLCPYCGEQVEVVVEEVGPSHQEYVEDCPVCCRPWVVHVDRGEDGISVRLSPENA